MSNTCNACEAYRDNKVAGYCPKHYLEHWDSHNCFLPDEVCVDCDKFQELYEGGFFTEEEHKQSDRFYEMYSDQQDDYEDKTDEELEVISGTRDFEFN